MRKVDRNWYEATINCSCHGEELRVFVDRGESPLERFVEVSFWQYGYGGSCWRARLRHIWHILWRGTPWSDMVLLDRSGGEQLIAAVKEGLEGMA